MPTNTDYPYGIVESADHVHMWFSEQGGSYRYGEINANGAFSSYALPPNNPLPYGITSGSDSRLWFGTNGALMIASDESGNFTSYTLPSVYDVAYYTAAGPDGNIWYANYGSTTGVGKITPKGAAVDYPLGFDTTSITAGGDGNMWFTVYNQPEVGHVNTSGQGLTTYRNGISGTPYNIVTGPDKNEYFTENVPATGQSAVAKITAAGAVTEYALPYGFVATGITVGPDKNI